MEKKLKGLEGENRRLLETLKTFGRRTANNAANAAQPAGGRLPTSGVIGTGGVGAAGVFSGASTAPLGISRPFRTVTPLHRTTPEMTQLNVDVNEGTSTDLCVYHDHFGI